MYPFWYRSSVKPKSVIFISRSRPTRIFRAAKSPWKNLVVETKFCGKAKMRIFKRILPCRFHWDGNSFADIDVFCKKNANFSLQNHKQKLNFWLKSVSEYTHILVYAIRSISLLMILSRVPCLRQIWARVTVFNGLMFWIKNIEGVLRIPFIPQGVTVEGDGD